MERFNSIEKAFAILVIVAIICPSFIVLAMRAEQFLISVFDLFGAIFSFGLALYIMGFRPNRK